MGTHRESWTSRGARDRHGRRARKLRNLNQKMHMVDLISFPMLEEDTSANRLPGRAEPEDIVLPEARTEVGDNAAQLAGSRLAVLRAPEFVQQHFHEKFPASAIAKYCGLSRFQFSRSFHHVFGITFREYLLRYRIREACLRLAKGTAPVTEIAYAVGFHDGSYFARMFRRYTGMLPSQYARAHGQNGSNEAGAAAARG